MEEHNVTDSMHQFGIGPSAIATIAPAIAPPPMPTICLTDLINVSEFESYFSFEKGFNVCNA
jgi:hypothetical protein